MMISTIKIKKRFLSQIKRKVSTSEIKYTTFFDDNLTLNDADEYYLLRCDLPSGNTLVITTQQWLIFFQGNEYCVPNSKINGFTENSYDEDLKGEYNKTVNISLLTTDNQEFIFEFESGVATTALMYCLGCIIDFYLVR